MYIQTAFVFVGAVSVDLSLFVSVVLSLKLKRATLTRLDIFPSLESTFMVLECARHLGSDLHSIRHFSPASIVVPHQEPTFFLFDFLYDTPGDLYLGIRRFEFVVFFVSRFDQTSKHSIPGVTQIRMFSSKDYVVHVWAVNCEVDRRSRAALRIRMDTRRVINVATPHGFEIFSNPNPLE